MIMCLRLRKWAAGEMKDHDYAGNDDDLAIWATIFSWGGIVGSAIGIINCTSRIGSVLIAPKVFILENLAGILKGQ